MFKRGSKCRASFFISIIEYLLLPKNIFSLLNAKNSNIIKGSVVTIGTFDGVHIGHQKIVNRVTEAAKKRELDPTILTFFPHPRMVLQPEFKIKLLNTIDEKREILQNKGIRELVIKPFSLEFANLSAEDYVKSVLVDELNAKHIIIGYDHRFGKNRSANIEDLIKFGKTYGFTVEEIPAQDIKDVAVSSTKIREALSQGNLELANAYLGYQYFISGTIIKGKGLGRTISFPTANLKVDKEYKLIPKQGVYVVASGFNGEKIYGMMNIGVNPTVGGENQSIEIHFFDFEKDLYGVELKISLLYRLRDEEKFNSVEALKTQLKKDKTQALNYLETQNE